jgi:hypothetical protein
MAKEEKKSIIEDALTDYKQIQEAAEANAAKKLADKFPNQFSNLLKEELNNNKDTSEKEPYKKVDIKESKKLDESEKANKESVMKEQKKEAKAAVNEERDKDFMGDIEKDTPNKEEPKDGDVFTDKITTKQETLANDTSIKEEFNVADLDMPDAAAAIDGAGADDIVTMQEIEEEISEMEKLKEDLDESKDSPFDQLVSMRDKLNEMISGMDEQKQQGGKQNYKGRENGGPTTQMIDEETPIAEEEVAEQKQQGGKQNYKGRENGGPTTQMIDEETPIAEEEMMDEAELDEAMGMAHSSSKQVAGDHLPGKDFAQHRHKRVGSFNNESEEKKFASLLEENKKYAKKINESKKYKEAADQLLEKYKTALDKYRTQLNEMAIFNTNMAHVNNLLVNEELALTQEDKVRIIKEFKEVNSIGDSKEKYDSMLTEMTESKKTLTESVEEKVTKAVGESSKQQLGEVEEKTAYENDSHINKIKSLIEYVERNDKKIIK